MVYYVERNGASWITETAPKDATVVSEAKTETALLKTVLRRLEGDKDLAGIFAGDGFGDTDEEI